jgi:hypothetical protein
MPEPDFPGLRSAVEDATEHAPFERLRERAVARRRRRRAGTSLGLLVVAVVALLTATGTTRLRSDRQPATPPPGPNRTQGASQTLLDVAFGTDHAYALAGVCASQDEPVTCQYVLLQSDDAGRSWYRRNHQPLPPLGEGQGFSAQLLQPTPALPLTIFDRARGHVYRQTERADTFDQHPLHDGPPIRMAPPGAVVLCADASSCATGTLDVLDPGTGIVAPLANQPPLGVPTGSVSVDETGGLWATGAEISTRDAPRVAYSSDRGGSWRLLPAPPGASGVRVVTVEPAPDGRSAYLVGSRDEPGPGGRFTDLWWIGDLSRPGTAWSRITPPDLPASAGTAIALADGWLLLADPTGSSIRVSPTGRVDTVPADLVPQAPFLPHAVHRGPGRLVYALDGQGGDRLSVLVSDDDGQSWRRSWLPPL